MADSKAGLSTVQEQAEGEPEQKESLMKDKPENKTGERSDNVSKIDKKTERPKHTSRASVKRRRPSIVDRISHNRKMVAVVIGLFLVIIGVVIIMEVTRSTSSPVMAFESDNTTTSIPTTVPHRS